MKSVAVLWMGVFLFALLAIGAAAPRVAHAGLNDSQEPGSVLVFPYFRKGTVPSNQSATHPKTEIEISVTCPRGTRCVEGGLNTVNGTLFFHPTQEGALPGAAVVPEAPCARGFLIVWVVDQQNRPIKYDGLIGNAVVREQTNSAVGYNAVGIQAGLLLPVRAPTDRHFGPGGFNGRLDFNGIEYMPVAGKIFGTVRYPRPSDATQPPLDDTRLILLTLDVAAGQPNQPTSVGLDFFKADETLSSDSVDFVCWTRVRLTDINPNFTSAVMGRKGQVESTSALQAGRSVTLMGLVQTEELNPGNQAITHDWIYSLNTGGRPVPTTFAP